MTTCGIEDCDRAVFCREWCQKHYTRWLRNGTTDGGPQSHRPLDQRFWEKVQKADGDECWLWTGYTNVKGYGMISRKAGTAKRMVLAHRVSYEIAYGGVPDGMFVCHRCDNPPCVRPDHLFLGTAADNNRDMVVKGRHWWRR